MQGPLMSARSILTSIINSSIIVLSLLWGSRGGKQVQEMAEGNWMPTAAAHPHTMLTSPGEHVNWHKVHAVMTLNAHLIMHGRFGRRAYQLRILPTLSPSWLCRLWSNKPASGRAGAGKDEDEEEKKLFFSDPLITGFSEGDLQVSEM